jgi:hypothetical protein
MLQNIEGHIAKMRKSKQVYEEHNQYGPSLSDDDDIQEITPSSMPPPSFIRKRKRHFNSRKSRQRESIKWYRSFFHAKNYFWSSTYN